MITFVYCCICLLIVCCHTARFESEERDYNNDSPDTSTKCEHYKIQKDIVLECDNHHFRKNITWEFMPLNVQKHGMHCDKLYQLESNEGEWKKLDFNRKKNKRKLSTLKFSFDDDDDGIYRCMYNEYTLKIFIVEKKNETKNPRPKPKIISLTATSNYTVQKDSPTVLQCKGSSELPAVIRWLKETHVPMTNCTVDFARLPYEGRCYCALPETRYASSNNIDVYISKLNVYGSYVESETYVCVIISEVAKDYRNVTIQMLDGYNVLNSSNSFSLLFLIPLFFVLVPLIMWSSFYKRKKKSRKQIKEQQVHLIKSVVEV